LNNFEFPHPSKIVFGKRAKNQATGEKVKQIAILGILYPDFRFCSMAPGPAAIPV
jgi:phage protein U